MKFTNKQNLPAPLVNAVTFNEYTKGDCDYSITELLAPPRIVALKRKHKDELTEDVSDRIWALIGTIGHAILQRGASGENAIVEKRFFAELDKIKLSGQVDYGMDGDMSDFKFVSIWVAKDGAKPEWIQQLNCYRWLAHKNGVNIKSISIVAIYRDWSKNDALRDPAYPQGQCQTFEIPVWGHAVTESFLRQRIKLHEDAKKKLPDCTADERWAKPPSWAVIKKGGKRALKVHYTAVEAAQHQREHGGDYVVETRPGANTRCEGWCPVSIHCIQWKKLQGK